MENAHKQERINPHRKQTSNYSNTLPLLSLSLSSFSNMPPKIEKHPYTVRMMQILRERKDLKKLRQAQTGQTARIQEQRERRDKNRALAPPGSATSVCEANVFERFRKRSWAKIRPTHTDATGLRHQVLEETNRYLFCLVKVPSAAMDQVGCLRCSGPHDPTNNDCHVNNHYQKKHIPLGRLMKLATGELTPYSIVVQHTVWNNTGARGGRILYYKT